MVLLTPKVVLESVTTALEGRGCEILLSCDEIRFHRFADFLSGIRFSTVSVASACVYRWLTDIVL
jgi:hypothetical protein